jgi:nitroreductase
MDFYIAERDMDFLELIKQRRSIRRYDKRPLSREQAEQILQAAVYAPSGGNNQSSHFLVIQDQACIQRLTEIALHAFAQMQVEEGMYPSLASTIRRAQKGGYDFTYGAPMLVLAANRRGYGNAMADCALAMENMFLQATAMGLGSCYINQFHWLTEEKTILQALYALGMKEEELICAGGVFGYPAVQSLPPLKRFGNVITYIR